MKKTANYNLSLYEATDKMSITASENSLNANMELIDSALKEKADANDLGALAEKDTVDKSDLSSNVQASLNKADSALQSYTETDPTVPAWAKAEKKPAYTADEVGADAKGTADLKVSAHNTATDSHNDIRLLIEGLTTRLNALADSDDTTLDQMSEIVAYIKANKSLIDSITTNKVNIADIIDNLTTSVSDKPLSAKQGVVLKELIDNLGINKLDVSALTNAINTALAQAKASGEFDGEDGESPKITLRSNSDGVIIDIANPDGTVGSAKVYNGEDGHTPVKGEDYYTEDDKAEIVAELADASPVRSINGKTGVVNLSASDVGALPDTYTPPTQTAEQVGADSKGTAESKVSTHNVATDSHNDIRLLISGLTSRLNALADSTDEDLDQLSEIVAYIKANKELIEGVTTNKVNVSDIINNLTSNVSNKPLSAAQGVVLKGLIDAIKVPTKLSELSEDSTHRVVTDTEKAAWNAKSDFSGKYADLEGKPTIPTVPTKVSAFDNDAGYVKNTELEAAVEDALTESVLPTHKNTIHKPQTIIVNNCQTSSTYKGSGLSVNTTDNIMGSQCVKVSGANAYIRFTTNVFDIKNNHLIVKIKVNSLTEDTCRILVKLGHTTNGSNYAWYTITKKNSNSVFGEWEEYTIPYLSYSYTTGDATALDFENINDVFVMLSEGTGDFDIQFVGLRPNTQSKGIISFTFDDSWKSQYTGIKTLAERGLTGTIYHIEGLPDSTTLTTEELKELVKYYGADIEVHGADFYNNMTAEEIVEVWKSTQQYLRENGLSDGRHLAYPGGQYPKKATDMVMKYFDSARTIDGYIYQESFPPYNNYQLRAFSGVMDSNVAKVKQQIDRTVENKNWLILVFHKIESGSGDMYCTPEALAEIADYAIASGANIMNIAEVFETNGGGIGGSVNIDDVINALPIYNGEVE